MRQLLLGETFRTGDVVAVADAPQRLYEIILVRGDGIALIAPWPASVRKRKCERRVPVRDLLLQRAASSTEHARSTKQFADRSVDYEPAERAAIEAAAARLVNRGAA